MHTLLLSPPLSFLTLSLSFLQVNRCTRRVPTSCPFSASRAPSRALHLILPLLVLCFTPFHLLLSSFFTPPNPGSLFTHSLTLSLSLSLSLSPPVPPPSRGASCVHLLRQCTAGCFGTQAQLEFLDVVLDTFFLSVTHTHTHTHTCIRTHVRMVQWRARDAWFETRWHYRRGQLLLINLRRSSEIPK